MTRMFALLMASIAAGWVGLGWVLIDADPRAIALVLAHLALLAFAVGTQT